MYMWNGYWHTGGMVIMWILIALVLVAAFLLFNRKSDQGSAASQESPEQILKRRFASGEIDEEEFNKRREALRRS